MATRRLSARDSARATGVFKALADPNRLEILRLIGAQAGPVCVCDITERFELSQPTISHHLKVLRDAGLLTDSRAGIWSFYELDASATALLDEISNVVQTFRAHQSSPR